QEQAKALAQLRKRFEARDQVQTQELEELRQRLLAEGRSEVLQAEISRLHREIDTWREQHAQLYAALAYDRHRLSELERRREEHRRTVGQAQQIQATVLPLSRAT
ncbi:MAG: hypothetical protein ACOYKZ_07820, partial [Chlamydiia bacterium]